MKPRPSRFARDLGARLRAERVARGWSLEDAALLPGCKFTAVSIGTWERGERAIGAEKLAELCRLYGALVTDVLDPPPLAGRAFAAIGAASALLERAAIAGEARKLQAVYVEDGATWPFADLIEEAR